ncbi:unnamed protein product [Coregonus sp. 'balchen']|nr:unnamed protein product [Coregonus sp. 'balchen']
MGDKAGTRVFKKSSPNCKVTVYLGKRDFVDHLDQVDPVDGVILVDPEYLKDRKVFVTLTCAFRYGREDLDVLGLSFRKDLYISTFQAFPPIAEERKANSRLQERLLKKLGQQAHPFYFTVSQEDTHTHQTRVKILFRAGMGNFDGVEVHKKMELLMRGRSGSWVISCNSTHFAMGWRQMFAVFNMITDDQWAPRLSVIRQCLLQV